MPGPPPKPPDQRRRRNKPASGPFVPCTDIGWQHGEIPEPPAGMLPSSEEAWQAWFSSWWASHWALEDLPALRMVLIQFDKCQRGDLDPTKLKTVLEQFGLTPYGRLKLHWLPPTGEAEAEEPKPKSKSTARLKVV